MRPILLLTLALFAAEALRANGEGLVGEDRVAWRIEQNTPGVPTPLFYQGRLFVLDGDRQTLTCFHPDTGQQLWQQRLGIREIFYSSPPARMERFTA